MSNDASTKNSAWQEALNRLDQQIPVLGLPRLVTIDHLNNMLSAARKRVDDSHAMQMKTLGYDVKDTEHDDMGISVQGDTHISIAALPAGGVMKKVLPIIAGLAAGCLPVAALLAWQWFGNKPAPPVSPADSEYEVIFYDGEGNEIIVPHISQKPQ